MDELNPAQLQEEQLLVTPEEVIQQHEWQYRFEQDQSRPEWHMITNDRYRASYIVLFTRIIGNITQAYPVELPPRAVIEGIVEAAIEEYRPIHRNEWPQGQRYQNYRQFTEYQTREFILGRIAGWLLVTNTLPQSRHQTLTSSDRMNEKWK